jgi:hypothetical protein
MQEEGNARMQRFMQHLTQHLADSMYAAAPHARKHLALRLLHNVLVTYADDMWIAEPLACGVWGSNAGAAGGDMPRRETRGAWKTGGTAQVQKQRASESPLGRFQPLCATLRSSEFIEVRSCSARAAGLFWPSSAQL